MDNINENAVETKVEDSVVEETIKCGKCGAQLEESQLFCPMCGAKRKKPNKEKAKAENEKKPASKKKKVVLVCVIFVAAVLLLVCTFSVFYLGSLIGSLNKQYDIIAENIHSYYKDVSVIEDAYNELTPLGQKIYKYKIIDEMYDEVSQNQYVNDNEDMLVDNSRSRLVDYIKYAQIVEIIDMDSKKGEKLESYISTVNELYSYSTANNWYGSMKASQGYYALFTQELKKAEIVYTADAAVEYIHNSIDWLTKAQSECIATDNVYNTYSSLEDVAYQLVDLAYGQIEIWDVDEYKLKESMDQIEKYIDNIDKYEKEVAALESSLPEL